MKKTALILVFCLILALFTGFGNGEAKADEPVTIRVGSVGANFASHFDMTSANSMTLASTSAQYLAFDRTFYVDPRTGEYASNIIDWEFNEDNQLVMTVKDGVYFGSGDTLKAEDILWTLQRTATAPFNKTNYATVDFEHSFISEDNKVCTIQFTTPIATYARVCQSGVMNKSWVEEHGGTEEMDFFDPALVDGTGPYTITDYTRGVSTTYTLKKDWWNAENMGSFCTADEIVCVQYSDETAMMIDYENGDLDLVINISNTAAQRVENDPSLGTLRTASSNSVAMLVFDSDGESAVSNPKIREAICCGVDTAAVAKLAYGALSVEPVSSLASGTPGCVPGNVYEYNPEYAKQCVEESGLTDVQLTWVSLPGVAGQIAEAVQSYLNNIGITVDLQIYDQATCVTIWQTEGGTDITIDQNANANVQNDPSFQLTRLEGTGNILCCTRESEELNEYLRNGKFTLDQDVRNEMYAKAQQYLYENFEVLPLAEWMVAMAYRDTITDCLITDVSTPNLQFIAVK